MGHTAASTMGGPTADIWNLWIFDVILELYICGCWRYWIGIKIGDYGGDGIYDGIPGGIIYGIHMDRDMATMKVALHLLWILDGIFDGGFYVESRGPKWTKLAGSGHGI